MARREAALDRQPRAGAEDALRRPSTPRSRRRRPTPPQYTQVFADAIVAEAKRDRRVIGITAAMAGGTGLPKLAKELPEQYYDVGIAEQHAVLIAAGLALQGAKPVCAIYSTFLQRAYDQIVHDVCLQKLDVVFAMDRAGLVGDDGPTHHGAFDISYFRCLPNIVLMAPRDEALLVHMLRTAIEHDEGPAALRYPRGDAEGAPMPDRPELIPIGTGETLRPGERVALLGYGFGVKVALDAAESSPSTGSADRRRRPLRQAARHRARQPPRRRPRPGRDGRGERPSRRLRRRRARAPRGHLRQPRASAPGSSASGYRTATSPTASPRSCTRRSGSPAPRSPSGSSRRWKSASRSWTEPGGSAQGPQRVEAPRGDVHEPAEAGLDQNLGDAWVRALDDEADAHRLELDAGQHHQRHAGGIDGLEAGEVEQDPPGRVVEEHGTQLADGLLIEAPAGQNLDAPGDEPSDLDSHCADLFRPHGCLPFASGHDFHRHVLKVP